MSEGSSVFRMELIRNEADPRKIETVLVEMVISITYTPSHIVDYVTNAGNLLCPKTFRNKVD